MSAGGYFSVRSWVLSGVLIGCLGLFAAEAFASPKHALAVAPGERPELRLAAQEPARSTNISEEIPGRRPAFRPFAVTLNPLSFIVGRFGANFEYLPVPHHALVVNPFLQHSSEEGRGEATYLMGGAELGYRFYAGKKGASGLFLGLSMLYSKLHWFEDSNARRPASERRDDTFLGRSEALYGVAGDLGGQHIASSGFTIGGGVGVMWLKLSDNPSPEGPSASDTSVFLPRFLFSVGQSF